MIVYNVFQLDMLHDGEGWSENGRMHIGTIEVPCLNETPDEREILEALGDMAGTDIMGQSLPIMAPGADLDTFFVDDVYNTGEWLEVGIDDEERMPVWGLELKD